MRGSGDVSSQEVTDGTVSGPPVVGVGSGLDSEWSERETGRSQRSGGSKTPRVHSGPGGCLSYRGVKGRCPSDDSRSSAAF